MKLKNIKLDNLVVNRANDRHGELIDEDAAIKWLLDNKTSHMENLAKDIAKTGEVFETPLVSENGGEGVVYDGNRRVTTLKLLSNPNRAPSSNWRQFYQKQRDQWDGPFPNTIQCQIENDLDRIDEILYRRHTGQQSGIGQSRWEDDAKTNFQRRTGKNTRVNIAEEIELILNQEGRISENERLPRSNMNRLMSAEQFRNRAGIAVENNRLVLIHEKEPVLKALTKIATDMIAGTITLEGVWDNKSKRAYLDEIDRGGFLPTATDIASEAPSNYDHKVVTGVSKPTTTRDKKRSSQRAERNCLIRNIDLEIKESSENRKVLDIIEELKFHLEFGTHDNSISVLFRVLLELAINIYVEKNAVQGCGKNVPLAGRFSKVREHLLSRNLIDLKYSQHLEKFENGEDLFSANTLNAYIHSPNFFPSDQHLKSMWDTVQRFTVLCLLK